MNVLTVFCLIFCLNFCLNLHCDSKGVLLKFRISHKYPTDAASLKTANLSYTGYFTTCGHYWRRWFPRSLWSKKFI